MDPDELSPAEAAALGPDLASMTGLRLDHARAAVLLRVRRSRLDAAADRLGAGPDLGPADLLALSLLLPDELPAAPLWPRVAALVAGWLAAAPAVDLQAVLLLRADDVALESDPLAIARAATSGAALAHPLAPAAQTLLSALRAP